jgi:hypothetical protein
MPIMGPGTGDRCFCPNCLGKRLKNYEALAEADLGKR